MRSQEAVMPQVRVTPLEIARLRFDLGQDYGLPARHPAARAVELPVLAYHLALPGRSVLVDAPSYQTDTTPEAYRLPGFLPPPPLLEQLRSAGIDAADVSDVVITHAHFDHLGALARGDGPERSPAFPHARHYLGRSEWDPDAFASMGREDLLVVERAGLLTLVENDAGPGDVQLGEGLSLVPAPGESPGHMLARAELDGDVVYVAGDLYHHAFEFDEPAHNVVWVDAATMRASKTALMVRAARERARVVFSHIGGAWRVRRDGERLTWEATGHP
jgi:glyoxylase-like metal-dependent hydrolase (beta-lactamase superfamily II)